VGIHYEYVHLFQFYQSAIAIANARLYQVAIEMWRMERELQDADQQQAGLLPRCISQIDGWEFAARWQPARGVAGDYSDAYYR
jgi:serine phosphatase RsbU (regulator of sigma subunit)